MYSPNLDDFPVDLIEETVAAFKERLLLESAYESVLIAASLSESPQVLEAYDQLLVMLMLFNHAELKKQQDNSQYIFDSIYRDKKGMLNRRCFVEGAIIDRVRDILFNGTPKQIEMLKIFMSETRD